MQMDNQMCEQVSNCDASKHQSLQDLFTDFKPTNSDSSNVSSENENEDNCEPLQKKCKHKDDDSLKKRFYLQRYRKEWENVQAYSPWLAESFKGNVYFYCKFCKVDNRCSKLAVEKHMTSKKHIRNSKECKLRVQKKCFLQGFLCPVFTPFVTTSRDLDVNYSVIADYAKYLRACGVKAILINDIFGEGMSLTCSERMKVTEEWCKACSITDQHLMVQIGGAPWKEVQEMARHAEKKKVGSIVVLPDLYNKPRDYLDLMRYLKLVSDCADTLPLLYHHNPTYTGVHIDVTQFLTDVIGEIDSFVGIIFEDGNLEHAVSALHINEEKFSIFMGTDEVMLGAFASGFNSIMGVTLNFLPKIAPTIFEAFKVGSIKEAREAQMILKNTIRTISRQGNYISAMKSAMNILTPITVGSVREPLVPLWQDKTNKLKVELKQLKVISYLNS